MAVYKLSFGEVTVADGMPEFSPELLLWMEEQVKERVGKALRSIVDEALVMSMAVPKNGPAIEPIDEAFA